MNERTDNLAEGLTTPQAASWALAQAEYPNVYWSGWARFLDEEGHEAVFVNSTDGLFLARVASGEVQAYHQIPKMSSREGEIASLIHQHYNGSLEEITLFTALFLSQCRRYYRAAGLTEGKIRMKRIADYVKAYQQAGILKTGFWGALSSLEVPDEWKNSPA